MRKHVLLYGLLGGVLIAGLKLVEYPSQAIRCTSVRLTVICPGT